MADCLQLSDDSFFTAIRHGQVEVVKAIIDRRGPSILTELIQDNEALIWPGSRVVSQTVISVWRIFSRTSLHLYLDVNFDNTVPGAYKERRWSGASVCAWVW